MFESILRSAGALALASALGLTSCVSTTLDTPPGHPAHPGSTRLLRLPEFAVRVVSVGRSAEAFGAADGLLAHRGSARGDHAGGDRSRDEYGREEVAHHAPHDHPHADAPSAAAPSAPALGSGAREPAAHAATAGADAPAARWTCPMHPEVVRDEPGKCPICGMKLVEQKQEEQKQEEQKQEEQKQEEQTASCAPGGDS